MSDIEIREGVDLLKYPPELLAALAEVELECPRGLDGRSHIVGFNHRQNVDRDEPLPRIMCLMVGAPFEIKEMYPWLSTAQNDLWDIYHEYCVAKQKALKETKS